MRSRPTSRIAQWIRDAEEAVRPRVDTDVPDELPPDVVGRLQAAVSQAIGQGYNLYTNRVDPQWFKTLADAAIAFARHPARVPWLTRS